MSDPELTGQPTPEEEVPEVAQENATTDESQTDGETVKKEVPVEKTFTQEELDEILQRRLAKSEARAERRVKEAYREALQAVTQQQPRATQTSSEPTRDQFASDAEWIDAKVEHRLALRDQAQKAESQREAQHRITKETETLYAKAEKVPGFDRETFDELPLTKSIASAVLESDVGPQLMAYMSANPDEVERISKLSDTRQAVELGKLEAKFQSTPKTVTRTPPPITPVGARGSSSTDLASADFAAYKAARIKQGARWAR